jgi:hypothetical protein
MILNSLIVEKLLIFFKIFDKTIVNWHLKKFRF